MRVCVGWSLYAQGLFCLSRHYQLNTKDKDNMKEQIKNILLQIREKNKTQALKLLVLFVLATIPTVFWLTAENQRADSNGLMGVAENISISPNIGVIGEESVTNTGNVGPSNSWPGEIVSSEISQIQPQREGVITEWRVGIGEQVYKGQVLGKISAQPATPELIKMLAEQTEAVTRAKAGASIADDYAVKEQARFSALRDSLGSSTSLTADVSFNALQSLRDKVDVKKQTLRSFVERTLANHVETITNFSDWRYVRYGGLSGYGNDQNIRNEYEMSMITLVDTLTRSKETPIETASNYFNLAVRFANSSLNNAETGFKEMATSDQKDFLELVGEYKDAQAEVADKETEYRIMISEKASMLEKDRSMAHVEAVAVEAAYKTVSGEITSSVYIYAPRAGSMSAIYKKVGDLVTPDMPIAVIASNSKNNLIVRMRIPSNIRKPLVGDIVSVVRPGFPKDSHKAKMLGVGISLDETGSYMADALILDYVDWPVEASVRVIASNN